MTIGTGSRAYYSSIEQRIDRYKIIYTQKSVLGLLPNYGTQISRHDTIHGRLLDMPSYTGTLMRYKSLKERSIFVEGPRLYNSLPRYLREHSGSIESFNACLDSFLSGVPDQLEA